MSWPKGLVIHLSENCTVEPIIPHKINEDYVCPECGQKTKKLKRSKTCQICACRRAAKIRHQGWNKKKK